MQSVFSSPRELINEITQLRLDSRFEEAFSLCEKALAVALEADDADAEKRDDDLLRVHLATAVCALDTQRWSRAENASRTALKIVTANLMAHQLLSDALLSQNKWEEALDVLGTLEEHEQTVPDFDGSQPDCAELYQEQSERRERLYWRIGVAYLGLSTTGQLDCIVPAIHAFSAARREQPSSGDAGRGLADLLGLIARLPVAEQARIESELNQTKDDESSEIEEKFFGCVRANRLFYQAHEFIQLDQFDAAFRACQRLCEIEPDSVRARATLALCYAQLGRTDEAVAAHQRVLEIAPDDAIALRYLALRKLHTGDVPGGTADLERLIALHPDFALAHLALGEAYVRACAAGDDRQNEAIAQFKRVLQLEPTDSQAALLLGQTLMIAGDAQGAQQVAAELEITNPQASAELQEKLAALAHKAQDDNSQSPDVDAIKALSEKFEENIDNAERSRVTDTINLSDCGYLVDEANHILHLYQENRSKYPNDISVKIGIHKHLQRMAQLYLLSIVSHFVGKDSASDRYAQSAAELLGRAWKIEPVTNIAYDFFFLYSLAGFKATALHWLREAERRVAADGSDEAIEAAQVLRRKTEAAGPNLDPMLQGRQGFPRRDTPGLQLQFQTANINANANKVEAQVALLQTLSNQATSANSVALNSATVNPYAPIKQTAANSAPTLNEARSASAKIINPPLAVKTVMWFNFFVLCGCLWFAATRFYVTPFFSNVPKFLPDLIFNLGLPVATNYILLLIIPILINMCLIHLQLKGWRSGWTLQLIVSLLNLLNFPFGTIVHGAILCLWFRPEVKQWFKF